MEEMRKMISRRHGETTPRGRPFSMIADSPVSRTTELPRADEAGRTIVEELAAQADQELSKAAKDQERIHSELVHFTEHLKEVCPLTYANRHVITHCACGLDFHRP